MTKYDQLHPAKVGRDHVSNLDTKRKGVHHEQRRKDFLETLVSLTEKVDSMDGRLSRLEATPGLYCDRMEP